jgi:alpha-glucosidase
MLGESLLVAVFSNRVYLPEGLWYNYWTKQPIMGGRWLEVDSPRAWGDGSQPLGGAVFVKGGAILPVAPDMLFSHQKPLKELTWEIYAAQGTTSFTHYDDDGTTFMYEQGYVATTTVTCRYDGKSMTITEDMKDNGHPELLAGRVNEYSFFGLPDGVPVIRNGQEKKQGQNQ